MKRFYKLATILTAILLLTSCTGQKSGDGSKDGTDTSSPEITLDPSSYPEPSESGSYIPNSDNVKLLGRTHLSENKLLCEFSGTGAEFKFKGTKCTITIEGDSVSTSTSTTNLARVAIYVDGKRVVDDMIDEKEKEYVVAENETEQETTVRIVKLSETAMSSLAIKDIKVEGSGIKPTDDKDLLIEFIGDSITCGYGVDDEDRNNHFSTATEDFTKAYAYKTAEKLDADYSMVAISGYGIISGYTNGKEPNSNQTIPQYYDKMGFTWAGFENAKPQDVSWDFSKAQPDVVVINLGTNDESYTKSDKEKQGAYKDGYVEFLKDVRRLNPNAKILCSLGIMGDKLFPQIQLAIEEYTAETSDNNIFSLRFDVQNQDDGYAADWHPTEKTHTKAADKLVEKLNEILN